MFPANCLLPQLGHFLLQECPFPTLLLVNELFVFTTYTINIRYGAGGLYFLSCLRDKCFFFFLFMGGRGYSIAGTGEAQ